MPTTLKYQEYIKGFNDCPPKECLEVNSQTYRFIYKDLNHPDNFKPVLLINPARIADKKFQLEYNKCIGYALSFYNSQEKAIKVFLKLLERNLKLGDNIATILLENNEGIASTPESTGHFTFYEYEQTNLRNKITNIEQLSA
jgi:hypothetical protein